MPGCPLAPSRQWKSVERIPAPYASRHAQGRAGACPEALGGSVRTYRRLLAAIFGPLFRLISAWPECSDTEPGSALAQRRTTCALGLAPSSAFSAPGLVSALACRRVLATYASLESLSLRAHGCG
eukprot:scaffold17397_cov125-Isochrysis_galbana.AAC.4